MFSSAAVAGAKTAAVREEGGRGDYKLMMSKHPQKPILIDHFLS